MHGLSSQNIGYLLRGIAHITPRTFNPRDGRFYPRLTVGGHGYPLGGFSSVEQAAAAYEAARMRASRGEPVLLPLEEKPNDSDVRRWYCPPCQQVTFGDREGEVVTAVESAVFVMHHALHRPNPSVRKFVFVASETGDLTEAAEAAGLSQAQVAVLLPRLRALLRPLV